MFSTYVIDFYAMFKPNTGLYITRNEVWWNSKASLFQLINSKYMAYQKT